MKGPAQRTRPKGSTTTESSRTVSHAADRYQNQLTLEELNGQERKALGLWRVSTAEANVWKEAARRAIEHLAQTRTRFTSDHVKELVGDPFHMNSLGAVINAAATAGLIELVGFEKSDRPSRHRSRIAVWTGSPSTRPNPSSIPA